jgi:hypothetical protein
MSLLLRSPPQYEHCHRSRADAQTLLARESVPILDEAYRYGLGTDAATGKRRVVTTTFRGDRKAAEAACGGFCGLAIQASTPLTMGTYASISARRNVANAAGVLLHVLAERRLFTL